MLESMLPSGHLYATGSLLPRSLQETRLGDPGSFQSIGCRGGLGIKHDRPEIKATVGCLDPSGKPGRRCPLFFGRPWSRSLRHEMLGKSEYGNGPFSEYASWVPQIWARGGFSVCNGLHKLVHKFSDLSGRMRY